MATFFGGCSERSTPSTPVTSADPAIPKAAATQIRPGIWRYTTRGVVLQLPKATGLDRDLRIEHETLVAFYNGEGHNVGMASMQMDFPTVAKGVGLAGVAVGDVVSFDFEVDWNSDEVWVVTRLGKLPSGTELDLGRPAPAAVELDAESK